MHEDLIVVVFNGCLFDVDENDIKEKIYLAPPDEEEGW